MPNIKEYEAPALGLQPSDRGAASFAQVGRRAGAFYSQAAGSIAGAGARLGSGIASVGDAAVSYLDHREISAGTAKSAELFDSLTQSWNETAQKADPNDPSVAAKWREEVLNPALDKFQEGFNTEKSQTWSLHRVDQIREHMFHKTAADMSTLAGAAVSNNIKETANTYSNTAVNDPSSVKSLLDHVDHDIEGILSSSPNIKGTDAAKARIEIAQKTKEAIVRAGAFGAIQKADDPEAEAARWAKKYPTYINGQEALQLGKAAKTQARSNTIADKQIGILKKQEAEQNLHIGINDAFSKNVSINETTGRPTINKRFSQDVLDIIHKNSDAPNAASVGKTYLDWIESQQRQAERPAVIVDDPDTKTRLLDGMSNVDNPTSEVDILRAAADDKLSAHTTSVLRDLNKALTDQPIKAPNFKNALADIKARLGNGDVGTDHYHKFFEAFVPMVQKLEREGKLPQNAFSLTDPNSLINKTFDDFKLNPNEKMTDAIMKHVGIGVDPATLTFPPASATGQSSRRTVSGVQVPVSLSGIAALERNKKTGEWRDQASGKIYDKDGNEIKK
jgi:hypothetical protein